MKKIKIHIATLLNLDLALQEKYGIQLKVRNYFNDEPPDPYFLFDREPSTEIMEFVRRYFENEGGSAKFSENGKNSLYTKN